MKKEFNAKWVGQRGWNPLIGKVEYNKKLYLTEEELQYLLKMKLVKKLKQEKSNE